MDAKTDSEQAKSLVIGATGLTGGYILEHLVRGGQRPLALSRSRQTRTGVDWFQGDLEKPETFGLPPFATLYCTANAILLPAALPYLFNPSLKRVVVFSSTSVITKIDSEIVSERETLKKLADAEQEIAALCGQNSIGWTILRPTLIYAEGRDRNITPLSKLIRRFGFMPLVGGGPGLRQPVHAEDLAIGAISAASSHSAANKFYSLPGGETLTYHEMIGRIFDGLRLPRRTISIPPFLWKAAFVIAKPLFPGANAAMGTRMMKDMAFDSTPAADDFGWKPRMFNPTFD
ncbi:NAD(P)-dependent oxidoreductase [Bradyrhizobium sp. URHD0069]|uniref:NAD-dependent epimerase/dehydratase family protein n=1 Tax=Bradyrhizobium sp. URHD0069 TaxID=1380355 RepID=UPI000496C62A|nr:epimerase [Bradyrhizobium sp. URHD0069]